MKTLFTLLLLVVPCVATEPEKLIAEVRNLDRIEGSCVGIGGEPGRFYEIATRLHKIVKDEFATALLVDKDPEVACVGVVLLAYNVKANKERIQNLVGDARQISVMTGCIESKNTVGEFTKRLLEDIEYRSLFVDGFIPVNEEDRASHRPEKKAEQAVPPNGP